MKVYLVHHIDVVVECFANQADAERFAEAEFEKDWADFDKWQQTELEAEIRWTREGWFKVNRRHVEEIEVRP